MFLKIKMATEIDLKRRADILLKFAEYRKKKEAQLTDNIQLPDDSQIRNMFGKNTDVMPNVRSKPIYDPDARLHRKAPVIRTSPKFVTYAGRNPNQMYITKRWGPRPAVQAPASQVTNPIYLRLRKMDEIRKAESDRVRPIARGYHATKDFQNRPPTKLETMLGAPRELNLGNSNKFNRILNATNKNFASEREKEARQKGEIGQEELGGGEFSGKHHRGVGVDKHVHGNAFRSNIDNFIVKRDLVTQLLPMRSFRENQFIRSTDKATNFSRPNASRFARNLNPPDHIVTRKLEKINVVERPEIATKRYHSKAPPRPEAEFKASNKFVLKDIRSYGKLAGKVASSGGVMGPRPLQPPKKNMIITTPATRNTHGGLHVVDTLIQDPIKIDGKIEPNLFSIDSTRGPQNLQKETMVPRGLLTRKVYGSSEVRGFRGIGSGTRGARQNPMRH